MVRGISKIQKWLCLRTFLRFGTSYQSGIEKAQYLQSFPKRLNLRSLQANQDDKGSLQEAHWRCSASGRKIGDLITAEHKVLNEDGETRNTHRHATVVQDFQPLNGYNLFRAKQNLLRRWKVVYDRIGQFPRNCLYK